MMDVDRKAKLLAQLDIIENRLTSPELMQPDEDMTPAQIAEDEVLRKRHSEIVNELICDIIKAVKPHG